ncbi:MAG: hypothetical protein OER95_03805 [Acidimicrobiia bacterium]|nr:hypothetical protein [Acidimicrobiia bacterium]
MTLESFALHVLNGVSFGSLLFFVASGLTLIFSIMRMVNIAHGSLYLIGGLSGVTAINATGQFWFGLLVGTAVAAALGGIAEFGLLRPVRGSVQRELLLTLGLRWWRCSVGTGWASRPWSAPSWGSRPLPSTAARSPMPTTCSTASRPMPSLDSAWAVARALMTNPSALIMDEPSEGLAPPVIAAIRDRLSALRGTGLSILLVEQNLGLALSMADRIYLLGGTGQTVWDGTPEQLQADTEAMDVHLGV